MAHGAIAGCARLPNTRLFDSTRDSLLSLVTTGWNVGCYAQVLVEWNGACSALQVHAVAPTPFKVGDDTPRQFRELYFHALDVNDVEVHAVRHGGNITQ